MELKTLASQPFGSVVIREVLVSPSGVVILLTNAASLLILEYRNGLQLRHRIQGQQTGITAVALSGKGSELIAGGADGFLKWWHVVSGEENCSTQFPYIQRSRSESVGNGNISLAITAVASVKGTNLVAAASGRSICVFGPGGEHLHTIPGSPFPVLSLSWAAPDLLVAAAGPVLHTWQVTQPLCVASDQYTPATVADMPITAVLPLAEGARVAAACCNQTIVVWTLRPRPTANGVSDSHDGGNPEPHQPDEIVAEGIEEVTSLSWESQGRFLAATAGGRGLVWDLGSAGPSAGGSAGAAGYVACELKPSSHAEAATPPPRLLWCKFQPGTSLLAVGDDAGVVHLFDLRAHDGSTTGYLLSVSHSPLPASRVEGVDGSADVPAGVGDSAAENTAAGGEVPQATPAGGQIAPRAPAPSLIGWSNGHLVLASSVNGEVAILELGRHNGRHNCSQNALGQLSRAPSVRLPAGADAPPATAATAPPDSSTVGCQDGACEADPRVPSSPAGGVSSLPQPPASMLPPAQQRQPPALPSQLPPQQQQPLPYHHSTVGGRGRRSVGGRGGILYGRGQDGSSDSAALPYAAYSGGSFDNPEDTERAAAAAMAAVAAAAATVNLMGASAAATMPAGAGPPPRMMGNNAAAGSGAAAGTLSRHASEPYGSHAGGRGGRGGGPRRGVGGITDLPPHQWEQGQGQAVQYRRVSTSDAAAASAVTEPEASGSDQAYTSATAAAAAAAAAVAAGMPAPPPPPPPVYQIVRRSGGNHSWQEQQHGEAGADGVGGGGGNSGPVQQQSRRGSSVSTPRQQEQRQGSGPQQGIPLSLMPMMSGGSMSGVSSSMGGGHVGGEAAYAQMSGQTWAWGAMPVWPAAPGAAGMSPYAGGGHVGPGTMATAAVQTPAGMQYMTVMLPTGQAMAPAEAAQYSMPYFVYPSGVPLMPMGYGYYPFAGATGISPYAGMQPHGLEGPMNSADRSGLGGNANAGAHGAGFGQSQGPQRGPRSSVGAMSASGHEQGGYGSAGYGARLSGYGSGPGGVGTSGGAAGGSGGAATALQGAASAPLVPRGTGGRRGVHDSPQAPHQPYQYSNNNQHQQHPSQPSAGASPAASQLPRRGISEVHAQQPATVMPAATTAAAAPEAIAVTTTSPPTTTTSSSLAPPAPQQPAGEVTSRNTSGGSGSSSQQALPATPASVPPPRATAGETAASPPAPTSYISPLSSNITHPTSAVSEVTPEAPPAQQVHADVGIRADGAAQPAPQLPPQQQQGSRPAAAASASSRGPDAMERPNAGHACSGDAVKPSAVMGVVAAGVSAPVAAAPVKPVQQPQEAAGPAAVAAPSAQDSPVVAQPAAAGAVVAVEGGVATSIPECYVAPSSPAAAAAAGPAAGAISSGSEAPRPAAARQPPAISASAQSTGNVVAPTSAQGAVVAGSTAGPACSSTSPRGLVRRPGGPPSSPFMTPGPAATAAAIGTAVLPLSSAAAAPAPTPAPVGAAAAAAAVGPAAAVGHVAGATSSNSAAGESVTDDPRTIFVGNLPAAAEEPALYSAFACFGRIDKIQIMRDKETGVFRGYAFLTFDTAHAATAAIKGLNGRPLPNLSSRPLRVARAVKNYERRSFTSFGNVAGGAGGSVGAAPGIPGAGAGLVSRQASYPSHGLYTRHPYPQLQQSRVQEHASQPAPAAHTRGHSFTNPTDRVLPPQQAPQQAHPLAVTQVPMPGSPQQRQQPQQQQLQPQPLQTSVRRQVPAPQQQPEGGQAEQKPHPQQTHYPSPAAVGGAAPATAPAAASGPPAVGPIAVLAAGTSGGPPPQAMQQQQPLPPLPAASAQQTVQIHQPDDASPPSVPSQAPQPQQHQQYPPQ
ncbi:hypothetical protein Agub_g10676, partial [Astrephomene gubernaculifera]